MSIEGRSIDNTNGNFRSLVLLFLPISLMTFSNCLYLFVEKLFLGRLSITAMEAAVNAAYACQIFQAPCVALAMMAQVFVGRWKGAQEWHMIGPGLWQFIWFALLSSLITVPCGFLYGYYYFRGTAIEEIVWPYYIFLLLINFLFPLGSSLSCYFVGLGKTRLVLVSTLGSQFIKLILGYILIFGWEGRIPSFGLMGGVFSTFLAQAGFCLCLFAVFFNRQHVKQYNTGEWRLKINLFWECIHTGLLRAANRILNFGSWACIAHLMSAKGGVYLLTLSIGGTLFLFLPFMAEAICQANITVISTILGTKKYDLLKRAFRSGLLLTALMIGISLLPLVIFYQQTFHILFPKLVVENALVFKIFLGVWVSFAFYTIGFLPISFVLAFKDTKFSFFMGIMNWFNGFLLMYVAINKFNITADQFWLVLSLMHASTTLLYFWRMRWLESRVHSEVLTNI